MKRNSKSNLSKFPLWAVMASHTWAESVTTIQGFPIQGPKEGPHGFIPLFFTREQAIKWAGSSTNIRKLVPNKSQI